MRHFCRALVFALATLGPWSAACSPSSGGGSDGDDGSSLDGSTGEDSAAAQGAPAETAPSDAALADSAPTESASDSSPANDASQASPDATTTTGTVAVTADASLKTTTIGGPCAAANSLVAAPNQTKVGKTVQLTASGVDPSGQSSEVTLTWTTSGSAGNLTGTTGTSNTFTCASAGAEIVSVTASISDGGASCKANGSLMASLTCTP
jgi:hypothetical protein